MSNLKVIVAGMGVQGAKRLRIAGDDAVATVDPFLETADYKSVQDVPLESFDAALCCVPDDPKQELIDYLLENDKHVLVEKPLPTKSRAQLERLAEKATSKGLVCYTAYNHRFEPHFVKMKELLDSGRLGKIYSIRMFYGNGTARLVRDSEWRDKGAGVLPDLGSHLLDTLNYWTGEQRASYVVNTATRFENRSFDHVTITSQGRPLIQLEMTLLMWRNHFYADVLAENGSAHISSLCKWGPSTFSFRERMFPSGRPEEHSTTLVKPDPTWAAEYSHFKNLITNGGVGNTGNDLWINDTLNQLSADAQEQWPDPRNTLTM